MFANKDMEEMVFQTLISAAHHAKITNSKILFPLIHVKVAIKIKLLFQKAEIHPIDTLDQTHNVYLLVPVNNLHVQSTIAVTPIHVGFTVRVVFSIVKNKSALVIPLSITSSIVLVAVLNRAIRQAHQSTV